MANALRWPLLGAALLSVGAAWADGPSKVKARDQKTTSSGLKYSILKQGKGPAAQKDQHVVVHYTGWLESSPDGTKAWWA
jgi:FKBP-type peptidyl-prolyl cis-trans isomerase